MFTNCTFYIHWVNVGFKFYNLMGIYTFLFKSVAKNSSVRVSPPILAFTRAYFELEKYLLVDISILNRNTVCIISS